MQVETIIERANLAAVVLRLALGSVFVAHGLLTQSGEYLTQHGLPSWVSPLVAALQIAGGALLILGIAVSAVSLGLAPLMMGAALVLAPNGWEFNAPNGGGWEFAMFVAAALAIQALLGGGSFIQALASPGKPLSEEPARPHRLRRAA